MPEEQEIPIVPDNNSSQGEESMSAERNNPEYIQGPNEEQWPKWLVKDMEEWDNLDSSDLKVVVHSLARRPDELTPADKLQEYYDRIDQLALEGKTNYEEAGVFLDRITDRVRALSKWEDSRRTVQVTEEETLTDSTKNFDQLYREYVRNYIPRSTQREMQRHGEGDKVVEMREKHEKLRNQILEKYQTAVNKGIIKTSYIEQQIRSVLSESDWNNAKANLLHLADVLEGQAQNNMPAYRTHSEYHGMIRAIVEQAAQEVSARGYAKMPPERYSAHRIDKQKIRDEVQEAKDFVIMPLTLNPHEYIGYSKTEDERRMEEEERQRQQQSSSENNIMKELLKETRKLRELEEERRKAEEKRLKQEILKTGLAGYVAAIDAQLYIPPEEFSKGTYPWFNELSRPWQKVFQKTQGGMLLGSAILSRNPEGKGGESLTYAQEGAIVLSSEDLSHMWNYQPGFRIAVSMLYMHLFDHKVSERLQLDKNGKVILNNITHYKDELASMLELYFEQNQDLLDSRNTANGPRLTPEIAARWAVGNAWNFIYMSGATSSADADNPSTPDYDARGVKDGQGANPNLRVLYLPRTEARHQLMVKGKNWGGRIGLWLGERLRHNPDFKNDFINNRGTTQLIPQRLMYSLLEMQTYDESKTDQINNAYRNDRRLDQDEIPVSHALHYGRRTRIRFQNQQGEEISLFDYVDPSTLDPRNFASDELWGGYAYTALHPTWQVLKAITGEIKEITPESIAPHLVELRNKDTVADIYRGESGEWIVTAIIAASLGGPNEYLDEILVNYPGGKDEKGNEIDYDAAVHLWLMEDRLWEGLYPGNRQEDLRARDRIRQRLHAYDITNNNIAADLLKDINPFSVRNRLRRRRLGNSGRIN